MTTAHDYPAAAELLNVTETWLRRNAHRFPRLKVGRRVLFTDEHIAEIRAMHEVRPDAPHPVDLRPSQTRRRTK